MKCPECGYNSFDYLESCKKCGAPLHEEAISETSARDASSRHGRDSDLPSDGKRGEASPEELLEIPIPERGDAPAEERSASSTELDRKLSDYVKDDAENESFENLSISNKRVKTEYGGPEDEALSKGADKQMDLFEESEESDYRDEKAFDFTEYHHDYQQRIPESKYEGYEQGTVVFNLAGFLSRTAAFVIDVFIVAMTALLAIMTGLYLLSGSNGDNEAIKNIVVPLYLALFLLASTYFIFLHSFGGKTVGKMILGIRLIDGEGDPPGLWDAFVRWIGYFVSAGFLFIGFLWALFDSEGQAWHDKIAGTYVVRD